VVDSVLFGAFSFYCSIVRTNGKICQSAFMRLRVCSATFALPLKFEQRETASKSSAAAFQQAS